MHTLWEKQWPQLAGGTSISIERTRTRNMRGEARYFLLLLLRRRYVGDVTADHVGFMHRGRLPVGIAAFLGGRMRERWWR
jgi:hypothetical protein